MTNYTKNSLKSKTGRFLTPFLPFLAAVSLFGCGIGHNLPPQTSTTVEVKDSTVLHIKDSIRIIPIERYVDIVPVPDVLHLETSLAEATAYYDSTFNALRGEIHNKTGIAEKTKIVYKDKIVYRDSIRVEEVPVEVEKIVEKKYIPISVKVFAFLGFLSILYFGIKLFLFFKTKMK